MFFRANARQADSCVRMLPMLGSFTLTAHCHFCVSTVCFTPTAPASDGQLPPKQVIIISSSSHWMTFVPYRLARVSCLAFSRPHFALCSPLPPAWLTPCVPMLPCHAPHAMLPCPPSTLAMQIVANMVANPPAPLPPRLCQQALVEACLQRDTHVVRSLLQSGASACQIAVVCKAEDYFTKEPFERVATPMAALTSKMGKWNESSNASNSGIRDAEVSIVKMLLKSGAGPDDELLSRMTPACRYVTPPLIAACEAGNVEVVRLLALAGYELMDADDYESKCSRALWHILQLDNPMPLLLAVGEHRNDLDLWSMKVPTGMCLLFLFHGLCHACLLYCISWSFWYAL